MSTPDEPYICLNERAIGLWSPRGQLRYFQINPFSIFQLNSLYLVIFHLSFIIIKCRQFELSFFLLWVISQFPSVFWRVFWIDSSKLIKCSRRATSLWWAMEIPQSFSKNRRVLCLSSCPSILVENENNWKRPYSGPILALRFVSFWHMAVCFQYTGNYLQNESNFRFFDQEDIFLKDWGC